MKLFLSKLAVSLAFVCYLGQGPVLAALEGAIPGGMGLPGVIGMQEEESSSLAGGTVEATVDSYGGKAFAIVAEIKLSDSWHAYFTNPGTVGLPVEAVMKPVPGFDIKGPFWALPTRSSSDLGVFYGYSSPRAAFLVTPQSDAPGKADFAVEMTWQACRDGQCLSPESKELQISLSRGNGKESARALSLMHGIVGIEPPAWGRGLSTMYSAEGNKVTLTVTPATGTVLPEGKSVYFFSLNGEIMPTEPQVWKKNGDGIYSLEMVRNMNEDSLYPNSNVGEDDVLLPLDALKGVLAIGDEGILIDAHAKGKNAAETVAPLSGAVNRSDSGNVEEPLGLLVICALLFAGGLILNLMPCVFPVLGLKVLSFVQLGGGERRKVFSHAMTFVLGVVASFWAITVILIILKSSLEGTGQTVNWAFWMENQWVIYLLMLLMLILGMSMFGIFEIGVGATGVGNELQNRKGYAGSFWSGVLATVVATPCSAPFLGSAIAPALALPSWSMWVAFTCMGVGMAFPYVLLGAFPGLVKYLPRPGAWMESFKQGLSFFLFAAVAWLLWTYMAFFDDYGLLLNVMVGLVSFCTAAWIYGRWCPIYQKRRTRIIGGFVALLVGSLGIWLSMPETGNGREAGESSAQQPSATGQAFLPLSPGQSIVWNTWSPEAVQEALKEGHPVFIDFTARWCLTCQANKKIAYTEDVEKLMAEYGMVLFRADKTKPNPAIDSALKALNRSSVPVNVLYVPGNDKPFITAEILTSGYLSGFFRDHLGPVEKWRSAAQ